MDSEGQAVKGPTPEAGAGGQSARGQEAATSLKGGVQTPRDQPVAETAGGGGLRNPRSLLRRRSGG